MEAMPHTPSIIRTTIAQYHIIRNFPRTRCNFEDLRKIPVPEGLVMFVDINRGKTIEYGYFFGQYDNHPEGIKYASARVTSNYVAKPRHLDCRASDKIHFPLYYSYRLGEAKMGPQAPFVRNYLDKLFLMRLLKRDYPVDEELWKLFNGEEEVPTVDVVTPDWPVTGKAREFKVKPFDVYLYSIFEDLLENAIAEADKIESFRGHSVGDICVTPAQAPYLGPKKTTDLMEYVKDVKTFMPVVGAIPKVGAVKSDGTTRFIFPMHLSFEAQLRLFFKNAELKSRGGITVCKSFKDYPPPGYDSYDIKNCEVVVYNYFKQFARATNRPWLVPLLCDSNGELRELDRFPSGIYGTSLVTSCFTMAVLLADGINRAYIHGDGILVPKGTDIDTTFLRTNEPDTLNSFALSDTGAYFCNSPKKLREPRAVNPFCVGKRRAAVLLASHRLLGAKDLPNICTEVDICGANWRNCTPQQYGKFCEANKVPINPQIAEAYGLAHPKASSWDAYRVVGSCERLFSSCPFPCYPFSI